MQACFSYVLSLIFFIANGCISFARKYVNWFRNNKYSVQPKTFRSCYTETWKCLFKGT